MTSQEFDTLYRKNYPILYRLAFTMLRNDEECRDLISDVFADLLDNVEADEIENIDGFNIPMENKMENVQTKHSTSIKVIKVDVKTVLPDKIFTQDFLNTGKF